MDNSKTNEHKKTRKANKTKKKFKPIYIIPIIFVICCLVFAGYIYSATRTDGPVYGRRCENVLEIDQTKLDDAKSAISNNEKISSVSVEKNCLAVKMVFEFVEGTSLDDAKNIAVEATKTLDAILGFEKNNPSDTYSKIFGMDGDRRQYDIQISLFSNGGEGFPAFGNKQYQSDEVIFTDANAKNQDLVDSLKKDTE